MSLLTLPVPLDETETPEEAQATGAPTPPMNALLALAMRQQQERQKRQGEANAALEQQAVGQRGQAQALRNLALLSSFGSNPLLRGMQAEAGQQGAQLEGTAARADARIATPEDGLDPLGLARLAQLAEYQKGQQGLAAQTLAQRKAEAEAKAQAAKDKAAAAAAAAAKKAGQKGEADKIKLEGNLRKALEALPAYKNYQIVATAYDTMQHSFAQNTAAGDISGITTFMKSIDPATGVRDQEFNNAARSGGIIDRATVALERLKSGQLLTPQQRREFANAAQQNTLALKKSYDQAVSHYRDLAADYKANPEHLAAPIEVGLNTQSDTTSPRVVPAQAMPKDASGNLTLDAPAGGDMVRVVLNGQPQRIPKANLEALRALVEKRRKEGKQMTLEVPNG